MVVESSLLRLACLAVALPALAGTTFRDDRIRLNGAWKFQLRRDNQLLTDGPVRFGPVTASSQATFLGPVPGDRSDGRIITSVPWPLASTLVGTDATRVNRNQLWRAHPRQPGPVWWRADLGSVQTLAGVRIHWVKPGPVTVHAEISQDGNSWQTWGQAQEQSAGLESWLAGPPTACRHLKLTFTPAHFDGTRKIEIFLKNSDGSIGAWDPRVQRAWFDDLRRYTPTDGFHQPGYSDAAWATIQVPGYWEVQKFSQPTWWQPDDTVGCYRRTIHIPERWRGRPVRWRFEGVNNSAQIWINGREVGYHESGFTSFEYDVTPYLRVGQDNLLVVRAAKWSLTHEFDTDDVWFLGGIWRDTYLYSLPPQRIDDFTLRTEFDASYQDAVLRARVLLRSQESAPGLPFEVAGELWDAQGARVPVENFRATGA